MNSKVIGAIVVALLCGALGYCAGSAGRSEATGRAEAAELATKAAKAHADSLEATRAQERAAGDQRIVVERARADSAAAVADSERRRVTVSRHRADSLGAVFDSAKVRLAAVAGDSTATLVALDQLVAASEQRITSLTAALDASERRGDALEVRATALDSIISSQVRIITTADAARAAKQEALDRALAEAGAWKAARASWLERHYKAVGVVGAGAGWALHHWLRPATSAK